MPRYFFDIDNHHKDLDTEGTELSGPEEARIQAIIYAGSLMRDEPGLLWDGQEFRVRVRSEDDAPVLTVHIRAEEAA